MSRKIAKSYWTALQFSVLFFENLVVRKTFCISMNTLLTGKYVVVTFAIFVYYVTLSRDPLWLSQLSFTKFVIFVILSIIATSLMAPFRFSYIILSICAILFLPSSFSRPRRIFQVVFFFSVFYEFCFIFAIFFCWNYGENSMANVLGNLWRNFSKKITWFINFRANF